MLIRSQDKRTLYNLENIANIFICNKEICVTQTTNFDYLERVGSYSTEAKAIEVLDKMQKEFEDYGASGVFQMPQDSEQVAEEYNNGWILISSGKLPIVPKGTEDSECPEFNVIINGAIKATTLKYGPEGVWFDDFGNVYDVLAWQPLPRPCQVKGE